MKRLIIAMLLMAAPCAAYDYGSGYRGGEFTFCGQKGSAHCYLDVTKLEGKFVKCRFVWEKGPKELSSEFLNGLEIDQWLRFWTFPGGEVAKYKLSELRREEGDQWLYIPRETWERAGHFSLVVTTVEVEDGTGD